MTPNELGKHLARKLFELGSEHQSPCKRIQFMAGNYDDGTERGQGGFCEEALAGWIADTIKHAGDHNG